MTRPPGIGRRKPARFLPIPSIAAAAMMLCTFFSASAQQSSPPITFRPPSNVSLRNEAQHAIDKGLAWLAKNQDTNGFWSLPEQPAITALALFAFKSPGAGRDQSTEPAAVKKGYAYLLSCVQPDGGIYRKDLQAYNTSIALMALMVANRPEWQPIIVKARKFIIGMQADFGTPGKIDTAFDGGIGYGGTTKMPDLSNTAYALEALYYSKRYLADKNVSDTGDLNWQAAIHFIQTCQNLPAYNSETWVSTDAKDKGGFIYSPGRSMAGGVTNAATGRVALRSYGSMTYDGLLSYIYADLKRDDPRVTAAMDWLRANYTLDENPALGPEGLFYYYDTLAKALTVYGADTLETKDGRTINWREQLALKLINLQKADGSWIHDNARWWEKDPALVTAFSLIALEMIQNKL